MNWIVIALLILVAAFGPLLWFKPSAKDKRLTALRARARAMNLLVDIKPLALLNPSAEERVSASGAQREHSQLMAVYSLILPQRLRRVSGFKLHRAPVASARPVSRAAIAVDANWLFDPDQSFPPAGGWPQSWEALKAAAAELPQDVVALVLEPRSVGAYWAESAGSEHSDVDQLASILERMGGAILALDQALGDTEDDDLS